jgi:hypothetical protein
VTLKEVGRQQWLGHLFQPLSKLWVSQIRGFMLSRSKKEMFSFLLANAIKIAIWRNLVGLETYKLSPMMERNLSHCAMTCDLERPRNKVGMDGSNGAWKSGRKASKDLQGKEWGIIAASISLSCLMIQSWTGLFQCFDWVRVNPRFDGR